MNVCTHTCECKKSILIVLHKHWWLRCHTELSEESSDLNTNKIGMTDIKLFLYVHWYIYKYI